jgi:hypothetical protein
LYSRPAQMTIARGGDEVSSACASVFQPKIAIS